VTLWGDVARTAAELADNPLVGARDANAYVDAEERLHGLASALAPVLRKPPADLATPTLGASVASLARLTRVDSALLRALPMAVGDLVGGWFESDALRAAIAARGILYSGLAPRAPGTAAILITDAAGNQGGLAGQSVFARGGPAAVANALAEAVREHGGEIRTAARVGRVRHDRASHSVRGVTLASGEEIGARLVVSTLDPLTTLLELLDPEVLGPRLSWRASNIRQAGTTAMVQFTLARLPTFPAAEGDERRLRGRILIAPSMHYLELAARPSRYGATAEEPLIEATLPSLVDPSLPPTFSATVQTVAPDADAQAIASTVTRTMEIYAPGFGGLVEDQRVLTPRDIEREFGNRGGHPMHAEIALDQWLEWRPLHGHGRYRMPLDGYYLGGAGAHPGGGVTGSPGRLAALEAVSDGLVE
jgi:phytoene dehydrogenase-like protein